MHLAQDSDSDHYSEVLARFKQLVAQDTTGTRMVVVVSHFSHLPGDVPKGSV